MNDSVSALSPAEIQFLRRNGWESAQAKPLAGDASTRRYFRLPQAGMLLMSDPGKPDVFGSYLRISDHLNAMGLSAPRVMIADESQCLALIEDWGESTYTRLLEAGSNEEDLYALAIDALVHLHAQPRAAEIARPDYDLAAYLQELAASFCQWFVPALNPDLDSGRFGADFLPLWEQALQPVANRQESLVLRDFHVDNLMLIRGRTGVRRCGLLDFQDAVLGPAEYDLVSLLQDARRDLSPLLEERMLERYIAHQPNDGETIRAAYYLLGAQRHARIIGVFVRLCQRDGKKRYLQWLPRVIRQFETALGMAGLTDIADFLDVRLPEWQSRGVKLALRLAA